MSTLVALYDACVLFSAPLRDLLMQLALSNLFAARWTNAIHEEWIRAVLQKRADLTRESLERTRQLMNQHAEGSLVEGFEWLIPTLVLPDLDDRHVLAAAIHCQANRIVTFNLADFPVDALRPFQIEAIHPDDFVAFLLGSEPAAVCRAIKLHRARLKKPPKSVEEYLATVEAQGLPQSAAQLRRFQELI